MEIQNEADVREMMHEWAKLPSAARKREIRMALERLELNLMYYKQKGNEQGTARMQQCIVLLEKHLQST